MRSYIKIIIKPVNALNKITMKKETIFHTIKSLPFLAMIALTMMSCSNEDVEESTDSTSQAVEDIEILAEIQSMTEVLDDMSEVIGIEMDQSKQFNTDASKSLQDGPYFSSCVSRTVVLEGSDINISLDFGSGCEGPHGNILAGVIRLDIKLVSTDEQLVTHSFEDFSVNGRTIEGSMTRNRIRSNNDGYPEVQTSKDISILWNENTTFNRVGQTKRIWVSGNDTRSWGDDVFLTTGNWNVLKNGVLQRSVTITKELRREMSCRFLVSGTMDIEGSVGSYILDFGDGTCDDVAVVTIGEREQEIQLGRLRRLIRK